MSLIMWVFGIYLSIVLIVGAMAIVASLSMGIILEIAHRPLFYGLIAAFLVIVIWGTQ